MVTPCNPCSCLEMYYRDNTTFKKAVLDLLCRNITAITDTPWAESPVKTIEYSQEKIIEGASFASNGTPISIAQSASHDILVVVPSVANLKTNMLVGIISTVEAEADWREGAAVSANGSDVSIYNRNRQSSVANNVLVYSGPTVTSSGTTLRSRRWGAGKTGGEDYATQGWILKTGINYLFRIYNRSNQTGYFTVLLDWHEDF